MKYFFQFILKTSIAIITLFSFYSCDNSIGNEFISASGNPGEILVVMEKEWLKSTEGEEIKNILKEEVEALPQIEPFMHVQTIARKDFGDFLRNIRNILIIDCNKKTYTHNSIKFHYDEWAKGQLIVIVQTPEKDSIRALAKKHKKTIQNLFLRHELYRYADVWSKDYSSKADDLCQEVFKHHINLPQDFLSFKKGNQFLWLSNNAFSKRTDVVIYTLPYSPQSLSKEKIISYRDSILRANIPGAAPDSYMTTTPQTTSLKKMKLPNGDTLLELKGLWETTGHSIMAGPFVAHILFDKSEQKTYYLESFIYHPNENKRELIRRMQAALFSFRSQNENMFKYEFLKRIWWSEK